VFPSVPPLLESPVRIPDSSHEAESRHCDHRGSGAGRTIRRGALFLRGTDETIRAAPVRRLVVDVLKPHGPPLDGFTEHVSEAEHVAALTRAEKLRSEQAMLTEFDDTRLQRDRRSARAIHAMVSGPGPLVGVLVSPLPFLFVGR